MTKNRGSRFKHELNWWACWLPSVQRKQCFFLGLPYEKDIEVLVNHPAARLYPQPETAIGSRKTLNAVFLSTISFWVLLPLYGIRSSKWAAWPLEITIFLFASPDWQQTVQARNSKVVSWYLLWELLHRNYYFIALSQWFPFYVFVKLFFWHSCIWLKFAWPYYFKFCCICIRCVRNA